MDETHGNYVIKPLKRIGQGGFGYVEKVELQNSDGGICGIYARKVFAPQDPSYRDEFIRRFEREVKPIAHIQTLYRFISIILKARPLGSLWILPKATL
jgi:serine/threonine protein kinase